MARGKPGMGWWGKRSRTQTADPASADEASSAPAQGDAEQQPESPVPGFTPPPPVSDILAEIGLGQSSGREQPEAEADPEPDPRAAEAEPEHATSSEEPARRAGLGGSRRAYLAQQYTEAAEDAEQRLDELLAIAAEPPPAADFDTLRRTFEPRPLPPEADPGVPPAWTDYAPDEPEENASATSGDYLRARADARLAYQKALRQFRESEEELAEESAAAHAEHERAERARERATEEYNASLDACRRAYEDAEPDAVESVLERALATATGRLTELPGLPGLPGNGSARVHYRALTRTAIVDLALPAPGIVPAALSFRPALDGVEGIPRPPAEVSARYEQLIARLVLRALYALLAVDTGGVLYGVVLNGRVGTVDSDSPCLISVDARYEELVTGTLLPTAHAEAVDRMHELTGAHSPDLHAQRPVEPRALYPASTSAVPAAEDLSQGEFAALAAELFERLGVTGWSPRLNGRDGLLALADEQVVCMARRPDVIGADAVRSAWEVAEEEDLPRCIWATTGQFHEEAAAFAEEHSGLRLIDGRELRGLIREHLGPELGG